MREANVTKTLMLAVGRGNVRLFRNNTGMGWQGIPLKSAPGEIRLAEPRPLEAGLCKGSSDLIGWTTVIITPEMVGSSIAVFSAIEVKRQGGSWSSEQINFINQVNKSGGYAGMATTEEEAKNILRQNERKNKL